MMTHVSSRWSSVEIKSPEAFYRALQNEFPLINLFFQAQFFQKYPIWDRQARFFELEGGYCDEILKKVAAKGIPLSPETLSSIQSETTCYFLLKTKALSVLLKTKLRGPYLFGRAVIAVWLNRYSSEYQAQRLFFKGVPVRKFRQQESFSVPIKDLQELEYGDYIGELPFLKKLESLGTTEKLSGVKLPHILRSCFKCFSVHREDDIFEVTINFGARSIPILYQINDSEFVVEELGKIFNTDQAGRLVFEDLLEPEKLFPRSWSRYSFSYVSSDSPEEWAPSFKAGLPRSDVLDDLDSADERAKSTVMKSESTLVDKATFKRKRNSI